MQDVERQGGDHVRGGGGTFAERGEAGRGDLRAEPREAVIRRIRCVNVCARLAPNGAAGFRYLHIGADGRPFEAAPLPLVPVKVLVAFAVPYGPQRLDVDALGALAEDGFVIDVV